MLVRSQSAESDLQKDNIFTQPKVEPKFIYPKKKKKHKYLQKTRYLLNKPHLIAKFVQILQKLIKKDQNCKIPHDFTKTV